MNTIRYTETKTSTIVEVLNDLLKLNNDRIAGYQLALEQSANIERGLKEDFKKIMAEGFEYKQQLAQKIFEFGGNAKSGMTILGKIYMAWTDLKVAFAGNSQKNILASCVYNEQIALHTYDAALNQDVSMDDDTRRLITEQEAGLRKTRSLIGKYRENRFFAERSLVYFN